MLKSLYFVSIVTAAVLLTGCGGGSDSETNTTPTIGGAVADGYLVGAKICLDIDDSKSCDIGEPYAITTTNGAYTIASQLGFNYPLFVEVGADVIDEDNGLPVGAAYTLSAPAGERFVSPLSTMVKSKMDLGASLETARAEVVAELGLSDATLVHRDYITDTSQDASDAHIKAQVIAQLKKDIASSFTSSAEPLVVQTYIDRKIEEVLGSIRTIIGSSQGSIDTYSSNVMNDVDLTQYESEINQIISNIRENMGISSLFSSTTIQQGVNYSYTYAGGTDLKIFEIADSVGKNCTFRTLDSTYTFNEYSNTSYNIDGHEQPNVLSLVPSFSENSSFRLGWMYYTSTASHVDFYVTCIDGTPVQDEVQEEETVNFTSRYESLNFTKYEGNITSDTYRNNNIYFSMTELYRPADHPDYRIFKFYNKQRNIQRGTDDWGGMHVTINGESALVRDYLNGGESNEVEPNYIVIRYDMEAGIAYVTLYDANDTIVSEDSIQTELNSFGKINVMFTYACDGEYFYDTDSWTSLELN